MSDPHAITEDLKLIKLNSHRINEPDTVWATSHPYKISADLRPPEFLQVAFICLYGGSEELIVRGKNRFVAKNNLRQHARLRRMLITGPKGVIEEIHR